VRQHGGASAHRLHQRGIGPTHLVAVGVKGGGRTDQGREIRDVRVVHRGGHGNDDEVGPGDGGRIVADAEHGRSLHAFRGDLAGGVAIVPVVVDLGFRQVVAYGLEFLAEFNGERQADVAQADNSIPFRMTFKSVRCNIIPYCFLWENREMSAILAIRPDLKAALDQLATDAERVTKLVTP